MAATTAHGEHASGADRNRQVLGIVAQLYLSESTVKSHLASSFRKLGVSSRAEATTAVLDSETGLNACAAFTPAAPLQR